MSKFIKNPIVIVTTTFNLLSGVAIAYYLFYAKFYYVAIPVSVFLLIVIILVNEYLLKKYIDNKIYKIYELLESEVNTVEHYPPHIKKKSFEEIERYVENWAKTKSTEISQLRKMESYRKEFLGDVSHELKTPIFIAQSYIETLLDGSLDDDKVNRKHLKKSLKSILRLSTIVSDLEMISKLEKNTLNLEKEVFDLKILIAEVVDSMELEAKKENIKIIIDKLPKENCTVNADKEKIEQVIYNLLVNAIKYSNDNEEYVKIICESMTDKYKIIVEDNGIGIKKKDLSRIFERFYRVDKDRSRKKGGTGLGLSIVKHILEAHGQKIMVESEYGRGSKFIFTLDRYAPPVS